MPIHNLAKPSTLTGIYLMLASMLCAAIMNTAIAALAEFMPSGQMVLLRNIISLLLVLAWVIARREGGAVLRTTRLYAHIWRASIGFCAMEMWFYALSIMPLNLATALSFTTPIFGTVFAIAILKEKAGWRRWAAVLVGFLGVLIIIRPGTNDISHACILVLVTSALMALAGVTVKSLTRTEAPETIVLYMSLIMTPLSVPFALREWGPVSAYALALLFIIAGFSTLMHLMLTRAYKYADMVVLLPFDFTRLVFTAAFSYAIFGETLDRYTVLGAAVIMASSLYIVRREARHRITHRGELPLEAGEL